MKAFFSQVGYLRQSTIIGQKAVTEERAAQNRRVGKGPKRARPAIAGLIPISKSAWWAGIARGVYPRPTKIGARVSVWAASDIHHLIETLRNRED